MVTRFLNGGNWIFGKIQFFEHCRREFHFCRREIDYTTFASVFFCRREIIWVRKTASQLRRVKTWLRTTMSQERLNYLMLLSIHKEKTDELDLIKVAHNFCEGNRDRFSSFRVFTEEGFPKPSPILWINFIKVRKI